MTAPGAPRSPQTKPRAVHFVLRDGGLLGGGVYLDEVTPKALREVPERLARKLGIVPVKVDGQYLVVAAPEDIQGALSSHYKPGAARP